MTLTSIKHLLLFHFLQNGVSLVVESLWDRDGRSVEGDIWPLMLTCLRSENCMRATGKVFDHISVLDVTVTRLTWRSKSWWKHAPHLDQLCLLRDRLGVCRCLLHEVTLPLHFFISLFLRLKVMHEEMAIIKAILLQLGPRLEHLLVVPHVLLCLVYLAAWW